jgi:plastocyanin
MNTHRGPWVVSLFIAAAVGVPSAAQAANATVIEQGVQYVSPQVDVSVGDTVSWIYESSPPGSGHTVTFNDRDLNPNCPPRLLIDDCQRSPSDRVSRTFTTAGTYAYYCKIHRSQGMTGVVVVTAANTSSTTAPASSTTATVKASTTTTTRAATSTTSTTRALATSSTVVKSTTTTSDPSSALLPGAPPPFSGDDSNSNAAGRSGGSSNGSGSGAVALIVGLLLAVSAGGGYLLWRIRPGRA